MITLFGDSKANMPLKIWREMYSSKEADDTMGHEVDVANYYSKKQEVSNQTTKRREVVVWGGGGGGRPAGKKTPFFPLP